MSLTVNSDFLISFGLVIMFLGGVGVSFFYYSNNYPKIKMTLSALLCTFGILFVCIPYRGLKEEYIKANTPIDNAYYYIGAEIIDQSVAGTTIFETENGDKFSIETNPEWKKDCIYLLTMDDNATPNDITDDIICVVWKEVN